MLKPFPLHWCLQYDWMWLNKTFIQVKLFFICGIVCSIPFWYHLCWCPPLKWWWWWWISWWLVPGGWCRGWHIPNRAVLLLLPNRLSFWTNFLSQWWQLNGFSPVWILSCTLRLSFWMSFLSQLNCNKQGFHQMTELNDFTTWLNFSDWMCDLNGNKWMHASEQQIVIIKSEQQNLIEIPDFLSTTESCPLLGAFAK